MRNTENWKPGKFVYAGGKLRASRNPREVAVSSRLHADLVAAFYDASLRLHVKGRLADLGCGKVPLFASYKDFAEDIVCVDWPEIPGSNSFADHEQDLNLPLCFADRFFDTAILSDVLEHIRNPEMLLREIFRVLTPGGKLLLNVPFLYWIHEHPRDYFRYTEFALRSMAEECGFTIISLKAYGGLPEILADMHAKAVCAIPLIGKPAAILIQRMTWLLIKTKSGKKSSARTAANFPLGYAMILEKPL